MSRKEWKRDGYFYYDKIRPFHCYHCNQNFADWKNFYVHYTYNKQKLENQIKKSILKKWEEDPASMPSEKIRAKILENKTNERLEENKDYKLLQKSYAENKKKRPFVCHMCGKNFRNKKSLKDHYKKIHGIDYDQLRKERENKKNGEGSGNDSQQKGSS